MLTDGQKLRQFVENQSKSVKSIYTELGVSKAAWYKYYESERMEPETKANIERVLKASIFNVDTNSTVSENKPHYGQGILAIQIDGLIESNRMMAAAMLADTENRTRLTKSNEALLLMVKQSENVQPKILEAFDARLSAFLAALSLVASGKRWKSATEAGAALHKLVYGENRGVRGKDIHDDSGT